MSSISNIQQIVSNISGVDKVQHVQQQQAQAEQARYTSEGQKSAEVKGKKIEDKEQADRVEISVNDDCKEQRDESHSDEKESKEEDNQEEIENVLKHIDIIA